MTAKELRRAAIEALVSGNDISGVVEQSHPELRDVEAALSGRTVREIFSNNVFTHNIRRLEAQAEFWHIERAPLWTELVSLLDKVFGDAESATEHAVMSHLIDRHGMTYSHAANFELGEFVSLLRTDATEPQDDRKKKQPKDSSGSRGRPSDTDAEADAKITDEWQESNRNGCRTYGEFAGRTGRKESDVRAAIDRHRKRP